MLPLAVHPSPSRAVRFDRRRGGALLAAAVVGLLVLGLAVRHFRHTLRPVTTTTAKRGEPAALIVAEPLANRARLFSTPAREAAWQRMRRENHPWYQLLKSNAERSGTPDQRYMDMGQWATMMYGITGDTKYAEKAWLQITQPKGGKSYLGTEPGIPTGSTNFTREHFTDFVWMYDWLRPWLTEERRKLFLDTLYHWADAVLAKKPIRIKEDGMPQDWPVRLEDSDNTVGHYFGLVLLDLVAGDDYPRAGELIRDPMIGGLAASASNLTSNHRNALRRLVESSAGGVWVESTEYNLGTLRLLFQGADGVRTLTGKDYFPEVTRFEREAGMQMLQDITPDLEGCYQWGDVQEVRTIHPRRRITAAGVLSGALEEDRALSPYLRQLVTELAAKYPREAQPEPAFYLYYDPYAPRAESRNDLPAGDYAAGQGLLLFHDGWTPESSLFGGHMATRVDVDHQFYFFGDFQLYRKGEWGITHPITYGFVDGEAANSLQIGGLSAMYDRRGPVAHEIDEGKKYAYLAGTTGGNFYDPGYYDPPPTFLKEWTRSLFYLPSSRRGVDTVVVYDRVDAKDPRKLPKSERYGRDVRTQLSKSQSLKEWILHAPVRPTIANDGITWSTKGGQDVRVSSLLPTDGKSEALDEGTLWPREYPYPQPAERKWQLRIRPAADREWDTFLNVVQVSDRGMGLRNTPLRAENGVAEGVQVWRSGEEDAVLLFSARRGERVLSEGYTVTWVANEPGTDLYLLDLTPKGRWTASIDNTAPQSVSVSQAGLGKLRLRGTGRHMVRLEHAE